MARGGLPGYLSCSLRAASVALVPSCTKRSTQSTFSATSLKAGPCTSPPL